MRYVMIDIDHHHQDLMGNTNPTSSPTPPPPPHDDDDDHLLLLLPLPEDVLIQNILVCLPVTSLLRFKSVCKSWLQLIQSSFFIDLHTTTTNLNSSSSSSSKFGAFILQTSSAPCREKYEADIKLYILSSESDDHGDHGDQKKKKKKKKKKTKMVFKVDEDLGFSTIYKDYLLHDSLRMVGSCNGIICLHDPEVMEDDRGCTKQHYTNLRDVCLWNPATRQFRILPKSIPIEEKKTYIGNWLEDFIVLGFDVKTKDYKVLRITLLWKYGSEEEGGGNPKDRSEEGGGCMCRAQVYSLSRDSWRLLEGINSLPVRPSQDRLFLNSGIYLNGSYFFVGNKSNEDGVCDYMLMSFDFAKEIFTTMQLPDDDNSSCYDLSYLGEKLAVFTCQINCCDGYDYYDIWVLLNEQHGSNGWTKLHSFRIKSSRVPTDHIEPSDSSSDTDDIQLSHTEPRCISNNGEFALISIGRTTDDGFRGNKLQLFNLITKEAIKDFTIGIRNCRAEVYKESLVSIMGDGNVILRWQLPTHGTTYYKLNLDAPFIASTFRFGIGLCLTSDTGGCIGVRSLERHVRDAAEGEALAMLEAIRWAKKLEHSPIIIESNSKNCVSFFMDDDDDDDDNSTYWSSEEALSLLREAKLLINSSELVGTSLKYCSRSCNYVADIAAKLGREHLGRWTCKDWTANFPGEMVMSLSEDLGLETWYGGGGELSL